MTSNDIQDTKFQGRPGQQRPWWGRLLRGIKTAIHKYPLLCPSLRSRVKYIVYDRGATCYSLSASSPLFVFCSCRCSIRGGGWGRDPPFPSPHATTVSAQAQLGLHELVVLQLLLVAVAVAAVAVRVHPHRRRHLLPRLGERAHERLRALLHRLLQLLRRRVVRHGHRRAALPHDAGERRRLGRGAPAGAAALELRVAAVARLCVCVLEWVGVGSGVR